MNSKIIAKFRLFDRLHTLEMEFEESMELTVEQAQKKVIDKLHETKDEYGNIVESEEQKNEKVFLTIIFVELEVSFRKKMVLYQYKQATIKNSTGRPIFCNQYGAFILTKTIM